MTTEDNAAAYSTTSGQGARYAEKAMDWQGWGSPVGTAVFLVGLGAFLVLARIAALGF